MSKQRIANGISIFGRNIFIGDEGEMKWNRGMELWIWKLVNYNIVIWNDACPPL